LEAPYKALWIYLLCECDHAGIWDVELDVAAMRLGMKLDPEKVVDKFGGAVIPIDGGAKWFLVGFIEFQYGALNPSNRVHASVLSLLSKYGIDPNDMSQNKGLTSPLQGAKDKDKDKDTQVKESVHEAKVIPMPFISEAFALAWAEWETSRREAGKPIKPTGRKLQMAKCIEWGEIRAIAALRHSAANGYQGLFEPNTQRNGPVAKTQSERDAELAAIVAARYATQ
jgi:hypothetical protein